MCEGIANFPFQILLVYMNDHFLFNLSCFTGWIGKTCNECIPMNGCVNGHCGKTPNTCVCDEGYGGVLCNEPVCK